MRNIGSIENEQQAVLAGAYLLAGGVECRIEAGDAQDWQVWVLDEDKLPQGLELLAEFLDNPDTEKIAKAEHKASQMLAKAEKAQEEYVARQVNMRERWQKAQRGGAPITYLIMAICIGLWALQTINPDLLVFFDRWLLVGSTGTDFLQQVREGEIWRLFTPALLHAPVRFPGGGFSLFGALHIYFNMKCLYDLGPIIERFENSWKLILLTIVCSAIPNVLQYYMVGLNFVGFSGVVFGLLGYLWIRGHSDPTYGIRLNPGVIWFMLIWLVLGFMGFLNMANWAHLGGMVCGGAIGFACAGLKRLRQ